MASTHKHIRSSTASKRPTTAIADGQIALNTNAASAGLFFKDSTGATIIKVGPVHVGTTAPNATPAAGGSSGNSTGEVWLDTSLTPNGVKIWNGSSWTNATPIGSTTVQGLLELATNAETQTGSDTARAVTPAGLQSKVSDSVATTSSTTIASSTAVKTAYDLADAALPKAGGTITGNLEIGTTGSLTFEGATADAFETTLAVTDPTADRTITLPDVSGNVVTTGDTGTVTSTMIANGTIVDADVNASAAIAYSKLALTGTIVDADVSASAEIAVSKLADGAARQLLQTDAAGTGVEWTSNVDIPGTLDVVGAATFDSTANIAGNLTVDTNTLFVDATNNRVGLGTSSPNATLDVRGNATLTGNATARQTADFTNTGGQLYVGVESSAGGAVFTSSSAYAGIVGTNNSTSLQFATNGAIRATLDTSGRLGVGTTSPGFQFDCRGTGKFGDATKGAFLGVDSNIPYVQGYDSTGTYNQLKFITGATEAARIDSSGRLLVGTSSTSATGSVFIQGNSGTATGAGYLNLQRGQAAGASIASGSLLGIIQFTDSSSNVFAQIYAEGDGASGSNDYPGRLVFSTTADGAASPTERMRITQAGGVRLPDVYNSTIALSANVFIDTDGTLKRATSSIKYKTNVETLEDQYADAVLNCRPVWYQSTSAGDNPNWGFWGFIAEEVAEIDPRLVQWKTVEQVTNEDGSRDTVSLETPEPENVAYDRFVPHLLNLIKRQQQAIKTLEAKVAALESA